MRLLLLLVLIGGCAQTTAPANCAILHISGPGCTLIAEYSDANGIVQVRQSVWYRACPSNVPPPFVAKADTSSMCIPVANHLPKH
jgi:hypothetical protein